ncbi:MAG: hypothetical protein ABII72_02085 [Parcubacteria group bacterium]
MTLTHVSSLKRVILDNPDPEANKIAEIAENVGIEVVWINSNRAKNLRPEKGDVWVECTPADGKGAVIENQGFFVDHHHPGDPGFGVPPNKRGATGYIGGYISASSIGQVISLLARARKLPKEWDVSSPVDSVEHYEEGDVVEMAMMERLGSFCGEQGPDHEPWAVSNGFGWVKIPKEILIIAALDHCPETAKNGECYGITGKEAQRAWERYHAKTEIKSEQSSRKIR